MSPRLFVDVTNNECTIVDGRSCVFYGRSFVDGRYKVSVVIFCSSGLNTTRAMKG